MTKSNHRVPFAILLCATSSVACTFVAAIAKVCCLDETVVGASALHVSVVGSFALNYWLWHMSFKLAFRKRVIPQWDWRFFASMAFLLPFLLMPIESVHRPVAVATYSEILAMGFFWVEVQMALAISVFGTFFLTSRVLRGRMPVGGEVSRQNGHIEVSPHFQRDVIRTCLCFLGVLATGAMWHSLNGPHPDFAFDVPESNCVDFDSRGEVLLVSGVGNKKETHFGNDVWTLRLGRSGASVLGIQGTFAKWMSAGHDIACSDDDALHFYALDRPESVGTIMTKIRGSLSTDRKGSVVYTSELKSIGSQDNDGFCAVWDVNLEEECSPNKLWRQTKSFGSVAVSRHEGVQRVAVANSVDNVVEVMDYVDGGDKLRQARMLRSVMLNSSSDILLTPNGQQLAILDKNRLVVVRLDEQWGIPIFEVKAPRLSGDFIPFGRLSASWSGQSLAVVFPEAIEVRKVDNGRLLFRLDGQFRSATLSGDGRLVAVLRSSRPRVCIFQIPDDRPDK